jgi:hypothetical protein
MTQVEQSIATVDDGDMELLLCRPAEDRLGNCGEVCWSLHASAPCWPPRRKIACCVDSVRDEFSGVVRYANAQQPTNGVPLNQPLRSLGKGNKVSCRVCCAAMGEQRIECTDEPLITFALLWARIARYGRYEGETH